MSKATGLAAFTRKGAVGFAATRPGAGRRGADLLRGSVAGAKAMLLR